MSSFVLSRVVDAPRERVWKVWTEREHLMKWFGPKGFTMPHAKIDLKPGGIFHYGLKTPDGHEMWGKWTFREIKKPEKLVFVVSFSDAQGGMTRHPMAPDWPQETLSVITFADAGPGKTKITVDWSALNPSDKERKAFDAGKPGMEQGWGGTFEQLTDYLRNQP